MAERKSKWRPGPPDTRKRLDGRLSPNRFAWIQANFGTMQLNIADNDEEATPEFPSVFLNHPQPGARSHNLNLTNLTVAELDTWKKLVDLAYEKARPTCVERDRIAAEAYANGDDSYVRSYRREPSFHLRGDGTRRRDAIEQTTEETPEED